MMKVGFRNRQALGLLRGVAVLAVFASVVSMAAAQPQPGLQYVFNQCVDALDKSGGITDVSGNGYNGTVIDPNFAEWTQGPAGNNNAIHLDGVNGPNDNTADAAAVGSGINTGVQVDDPNINIFQGPFTCMAWINRDRNFGEDMVFGTPPPNAPGSGEPRAGSLHLGFRGGQAYYGFWGGSTGRDGNAVNEPFCPGTWHHLAWRFDGAGTGGNQDILIDGLVYSTHLSSDQYGGLLQENNNVPNVATVLLIGRTVANNGAFTGSLSDVRVYNTALDDCTIAAIANSPP